MFLFKPQNIDFITSLFTRQQGYTKINGSRKLSHKQAIEILNSFTPQGASPRISLRIGRYRGEIGIGYYFMESDERAKISTILLKDSINTDTILQLPFDEFDIMAIANGNRDNFFRYNSIESKDYWKLFHSEQLAIILYSLLVGDNIILVHSDHSERLEFISRVLQIMPSIIFDYNRITSSCAELEGNENIVGVAELPQKYRSHKKLFLPLDTIFVDLNTKRIQGEGMKTCEFAKGLSTVLKKNIDHTRDELCNFFKKVSSENFDPQEYTSDEPTQIMINRIRSKMGLDRKSMDNWIMTF